MEVMRKIEQHFLENEKDAVESVFTVQGFSFGGSGQNTGIAFVKLKDWAERKGANLGVDAVARRAMGAFSQIKDAHRVRLPAAGDARARHRRGLRLLAEGQRGPGPRRPDAGAQPVARRGRAEQAARERAPQRPGRHAAVPHRRRHGKGRRARPDDRETSTTRCRPRGAVAYIDDFVDRGRVKRVYHAGRRAVPHAARGLRPLVRAQQQGRDGAVLGLRDLALGLRLAAPRALQRRVARWRSRARRRRA